MGWIKIDRGLLDSAIWTDNEPFNKRAAWIDLLLLANYEDTEQIVGYEVIKIPRGTYMTTIRDLSKRWDWSNSKVLSFLHFLENQKMVTLKANTKRTLITIVKYRDFQDGQITKRTQTERKPNASRTQKENLLYKERREEIKNIDSKQKYGEFKNVLLTSEEYTKLCQNLDDADGLIERLSAYIESTGKKYKSHYATLLNWNRRDNKAAGAKQSGGYFNAASYVASTIFESEGLNEVRGN